MKFLVALFFVVFVIWSTAGGASAQADDSILDPAIIELRWQHKHGAVRDSYWDRIAWCETHANWQDRGRFAGGLGIAESSWIRFGGNDFGKPWNASRLEQIVIANRISIFGHQTKNVYMTDAQVANHQPIFIQPVGFRGWGCSRVVGVPRNKPRIR